MRKKYKVQKNLKKYFLASSPTLKFLGLSLLCRSAFFEGQQGLLVQFGLYLENLLNMLLKSAMNECVCINLMVSLHKKYQHRTFFIVCFWRLPVRLQTKKMIVLTCGAKG